MLLRIYALLVFGFLFAPLAVVVATSFTASNFAAYGTDTTYSADSDTGFDASDADAGFTTGVSGHGKFSGVVGTVTSP